MPKPKSSSLTSKLQAISDKEGTRDVIKHAPSNMPLWNHEGLNELKAQLIQNSK